jgi:N-acyl-D-amino-acid deacylase
VTHDLVIRNGTVVDGTGAAARRADVAVDAGRITVVGDVDDGALEEIDAAGLVVTPGFVDPHTHLEAQLCWDPDATPSSMHGVTTALFGMCGFGIAPCADGGGDYLLRSLEVVEEIPFESSSRAVPFAWHTWPVFLRYLEDQALAVNVGGMVPHSALRCYVMGDGARERAATPEERAQLAAELRRSLDGGALGFATSRGPNHVDAYGQPVPSRFADHAELRELVLECRGRPWQINLENKISTTSDPITSEVEIYAAWTRAAGARMTWSPFFAEPSEAVWRAVVEHNDRLNADVEVRPQVSPYPITATLRFDSEDLTLVAGWASTMEHFARMSAEERRRHLADPDVRDALRDAPALFEATPVEQRPYPAVAPRYDEWIVIGGAPADALGHTLSEVAVRTGDPPSNVLCDLAAADLSFELQVPLVNVDLRQAASLSAVPGVLIGLGDAGAHVATVANYTYPTAMLADLVRDQGTYALETAVQRLTSDPARFFGVPERGELRPGAFADVCVIDLEHLGVTRTEMRNDLPGGARRLYRGATGYRAVVVNGDVTIRDDELTGAHPGRAVRPTDR